MLAIFRFTKDFGKEYKYTVGESLKKETIELRWKATETKKPINLTGETLLAI